MSWSNINKKYIDSDPRSHHYELGHIAFRKLCHSDPLNFFTDITSEYQVKFINHLWKQVCENFDTNTDISTDEIKVHTVELHNYPSILIEMPTPKAVSEVIYISISLIPSEIKGTPTILSVKNTH